MHRGQIQILDRTLRSLFSILLLSLLFLFESNWRFFGLLGLFPLFNPFTGICFFYRLFGINTCRVK
ncbi:DUF2892 domain-containing protein [Brevibacillus invocatus]|uniref:YgaP family membrane protein n=1 Tax=Brevibacillus invocatus TaxID=173959 RepID=UPI001C82C0BD